MLRRIARPLLAASFISSGIQALRDPKPYEPAVARLREKGKELAPDVELPEPTRLIQMAGGVKVGAGAMLALGWTPRLASLALAGVLIPSTAVDHPFWETSDPTDRMNQQAHFAKNLGLFGGLLLVALEPLGRRRPAKRAAKAAKRAGQSAEVAAHRTQRAGKRVGKRASKQVNKKAKKLAG